MSNPTSATLLSDADGFVPTDDPAVRVAPAAPHALCDVFGHQWHVFSYPMCMVFNPETGEHLFDTYHVIGRRCPTRVLVERKPEQGPPDVGI